MHLLEPASPEFQPALQDFLATLGPRLDTASDFLRDYMIAYGEGAHFLDKRLLLRSPEASAALIVSVQQNEGEASVLSNWGLPISYLGSHHPSLQKPLAKHFRGLIEDHQIARFHYRDTTDGGTLSPLTEIIYALEGDLAITPGFTSWTDLSLSEEQLWSRLRKSYRSLINWGKKHLELTTHSGPGLSDEVCQACRDLHQTAAGRVTRSAESWRVHADLAREDKAFYALASLDGEAVAFAYISLEQANALYSCAAARRDLFDKPLNHALLWHSMLEAQRRGLTLFHLGESMFARPGEADPKERNIALFKRGFATETRPHLDLHWTAP